ncbi:MAG: YciI family protein [Candidatus Aquilonibacter sp.]
MRFLVLVKATKASEAGELPTKEMLAEMGAFNDTLRRDGIFLGGEGLKPTSQAARISFAGGKPTVTDGPFTETKELVAGFWLLQGRSKDEIVERMSRAPFEGGELEIRPFYELEDFKGIL